MRCALQLFWLPHVIKIDRINISFTREGRIAWDRITIQIILMARATAVTADILAPHSQTMPLHPVARRMDNMSSQDKQVALNNSKGSSGSSRLTAVLPTNHQPAHKGRVPMILPQQECKLRRKLSLAIYWAGSAE